VEKLRGINDMATIRELIKSTDPGAMNRWTAHGVRELHLKDSNLLSMQVKGLNFSGSVMLEKRANVFDIEYGRQHVEGWHSLGVIQNIRESEVVKCLDHIIGNEQVELL
jgi:hypothetical protein